LRDLVKQQTLVPALQIALEQLQGVLVPLDGFWTAVVAPLVL
jgi:hypothetical protein